MRFASIVKVTGTLALLAGTISLGIAYAEEQLALDNDTAKINYSLGYQIGGDFKRQGVEIDAQAVIKGIEDALSGATPLMPPDEMQATLIELKRKVTEIQRTRNMEAELQFIEQGKAYMTENAGKAGVNVTDSGLQYRIIEAGTGKNPAATDQVTVNYRGSLTNGNPFDSGEGVSFPLNGVIKGWTEGLQLIKEGGTIELVIPPELAYGDRGPLANRTLVFEVELISASAPKSN